LNPAAIIRFEWPSIDYEQVDTETCQKIFSLVGTQKTIDSPDYRNVVPETPQHVQIARHIDSILMERQYRAKKRVFAAQTLDERIRKDLEPIFDFLRAARRTGTEHFTFPHPKHKLLQNLASAEQALYTIADMVRGNEDIDLDATEPDSEPGDTTLLVEEGE
jgi:hypothetical protein